MRYHEFKLHEATTQQSVGTTTLGGFPVTVLNVEETGFDEAIHLNPPHKIIPRKELHSYVDRVKTDTKTKRDKFKPIIHASNVKAIIKSDNPNDVWDLDDLAAQIMQRPTDATKMIGVNSKMSSSAKPGTISQNTKISKTGTQAQRVFDITLPALNGIVVDEETMDFVEINTCIGAGLCQIFCFARKGGYRQFPASSMSAARTLNFLVNDPEGYMNLLSREIGRSNKTATRKNQRMVVRWHDAGDFFSKEYLELAYNVARQHPTVHFYFYTKVADVYMAEPPPNVVRRWSIGANPVNQKKIDRYQEKGNVVLDAPILTKDVWKDLITPIKVPNGKDEMKTVYNYNNHAAIQTLKQRVADKFNVDPKTVLTYDQLLKKTREGKDPIWTVITTPSDGDNAAMRRDVLHNVMLIH
jgi:Gene product 88